MSDEDHFQNAKAVIILLAMPGCPACEDYKPRFERMVDGFQRYGVPFEYYQNRPVAKGKIPVLVLDATSSDQRIQQFCDQHKISGMPTTMVFTRLSAKPMQLEGAVDDPQIFALLSKAAQSAR